MRFVNVLFLLSAMTLFGFARELHGPAQAWEGSQTPGNGRANQPDSNSVPNEPRINWSAWTTAKDDPQVQFRSACSRTSANRALWSVEVANNLPGSLAVTAKHSIPTTQLASKGNLLHRFFISGLRLPRQLPQKEHLILDFVRSNCNSQPKVTTRQRTGDYTRKYVYKNGHVNFSAGGNEPPGPLAGFDRP